MPLHTSEENSNWKGRGGGPGLGMNIRCFVIYRGRKIGGSEGIFSAVTWCLFLLVMVGETVEANRPPRFVLDGNIGSEIEVRMKEGEGV